MGIIPTPENTPGGISGAAFARAVANGGSIDPFYGYIPVVANETIPIVISSERPFAIPKVVTDCGSGTCQVEVRINSTPLGGGANSVSTTRQTKDHTSANSGQIGDDVSLVFSSNSNCQRMNWVVIFEYPTADPE
ncbi:hypothetical protein G3545_14055 [Starkeya sp. ORNL1]|uniref:hypothetical protein n=1 Tax=Starkeya sp. ORNL1 TaxID=2709380 RepID=UPI0014638C2E|nr:hypothetical protein [Starkeya sp. ORNL1]QJP14667.1 hypothetical protein G3545_14055 [Starkeya sp. ORNL1]